MASHRIITIILMIFVLCGCAGQRSITIPSPKLDTLYEKRNDKVYVLIENTERLNKNLSTCGINCRQLIFTHNLEQVVLSSTKQAIETVFSDVTYISTPPAKSDALDKKVFIISFEQPNTNSCTFGLYSIKQYAQITITAHVATYDTRGNRLFSGRVIGIDKATGEEGMFQCGHEDEVIIPAFTGAIQKFSNDLLHLLAAMRR